MSKEVIGKYIAILGLLLFCTPLLFTNHFYHWLQKIAYTDGEPVKGVAKKRSDALTKQELQIMELKEGVR